MFSLILNVSLNECSLNYSWPNCLYMNSAELKNSIMVIFLWKIFL